MKIIPIIVALLLSIPLFAQDCSDGTHSTNLRDSWLSCSTSANPNPLRGNTHWVLYDLGYLYQIDGTKFWNYNVAGETDKGMKNLVIDYSIDGINWTEAANFQLAQASGTPDYVGQLGPNLGAITTRYILISATDTWGNGDCAGLSEVRFDISGIVNDVNDLTTNSKEITLYPNPTNGKFNVRTQFESFPQEKGLSQIIRH